MEINIYEFCFTAQTTEDLKRVHLEKDKMEKEKDERIKELEIKINTMGLAYENVLNVSLQKILMEA